MGFGHDASPYATGVHCPRGPTLIGATHAINAPEKPCRKNVHGNSHSKKKRVQFHLEYRPDDDSSTTCSPAIPSVYGDDTPTALSTYDDDLPGIWWNKDEYDEIRDDALNVSDYYIESCKDYTEKFLAIFSLLKQSDENRVFPKDACLMSYTSARGLENVIYPILNHFRRKAVRGVLQAQSNLPHDLDLDVRQRLLSAKSRYLSKPARVLAKVLGDGDALVADIVQREEEPNQ